MQFSIQISELSKQFLTGQGKGGDVPRISTDQAAHNFYPRVKLQRC